MIFPTQRHHWSLDFSYPNLNWNELNLVWGGKNESVQHVPFSLSTVSTKNKRNKRDSQRIETYMYWCLLPIGTASLRLETKSGQIGSQGKPTQTTRLEKEAAKSTGKHFRNPNIYPCNSMMNDKFPVATWDIWKQRKSLHHHSFTQVHPKWHKWKRKKNCRAATGAGTEFKHG